MMKKLLSILVLSFLFGGSASAVENKIFDKNEEFILIGVDANPDTRPTEAGNEMYSVALNHCRSFEKFSYQFYKRRKNQDDKLGPLPDFSLKYNQNFNTFRFICTKSLEEAFKIFLKNKNFISVVDQPTEYRLFKFRHAGTNNYPTYFKQADYDKFNEIKDKMIAYNIIEEDPKTDSFLCLKSLNSWRVKVDKYKSKNKIKSQYDICITKSKNPSLYKRITVYNHLKGGTSQEVINKIFGEEKFTYFYKGTELVKKDILNANNLNQDVDKKETGKLTKDINLLKSDTWVYFVDTANPSYVWGVSKFDSSHFLNNINNIKNYFYDDKEKLFIYLRKRGGYDVKYIRISEKLKNELFPRGTGRITIDKFKEYQPKILNELIEEYANNSLEKDNLIAYFYKYKPKIEITKAEPSQNLDAASNIEKKEVLDIFNKDFDALKQEWNKFEKSYNDNKKSAQKTYSSISANDEKLKPLAKKLDTAISIVFDINKFNDLKKEYVELENLNKSANLDASTLDINLINSKITSINNKVSSVNSFIDENIIKLVNEIELLENQSLKEKIKDVLYTIGIVIGCLVLAGILFFSLRKMDLSNLKSQSVNATNSLNTINSNIVIMLKEMLEKLMIISKRNTSTVVVVSVVIVVFALQNFTEINLNPFAKDEYANIDPSTLSKDEKNAYTCVKTYGFKKGTEQFRKCIADINQQEIEKRKIEVEKTAMEEKLARAKVEEAELAMSKKYDNVDFDDLSNDEKKAYTCVKTFGHKVGSPTFQQCINKITEGELELKRIEIEKKVAEAQLLTAKANKEAALAKAEAARAQGEIQKAQVEAARAAAEASKQAAAAAQARAKAEDFKTSMSLIELGLKGLQPQQPRASSTFSLDTRCVFVGNIMRCH